jgi:crossover junction endodeoxyribonuclease RusA
VKSSFFLPWPPSNNTYYRRVGNKTLISKKGREYKKAVLDHCMRFGVKPFGEDKISISIIAYYPDRRRRDLDNLLKAPLDAMMKAGVYQDDSQVESLSIKKGDQEKPGMIFIDIEALEDE